MHLRMIFKQWAGYGVAGAALLWLISSGPGWYHLLKLRKQVVTLRRSVAALKLERNALRDRSEQFDAHRHPERARFARVQHARQVLQLGKPGEVIYECRTY